MMRRLLAWFRPDPPRTVRVLFDGYTQPKRHEGERLRAFRLRQIDAVMLGSEVYDHTQDDDEPRRAA